MISCLSGIIYSSGSGLRSLAIFSTSYIGLAFILHSQTTMTFQPALRRSWRLRLSRAMLLSNFFCQNSLRVDGVEACLHPLCLCQKQPCTNITVLYFGRTISGLPGRSLQFILNRNPMRCRRLRTISSGFVFAERIRDIFQLRLSCVK